MFNTAISFVTNTNWQGYGGETSMSYRTQMLGLGVQNILSAATGMAILAALMRGFRSQHLDTIGNFWVDLTRSTLKRRRHAGVCRRGTAFRGKIDSWRKTGR